MAIEHSSTDKARPAGASGSEAVISIPVEAIDPNPGQPRRHFDPARLEALARSIEGQGVMQPVVVRPHPDLVGRFQLVAGERRWRAVAWLGWARLPALVRQVPDEYLLEAALVENIQREALTPIEEAAAYRTLLQQYGYTQETLAERVGKDRSTIANMVRLLSLPPGLREDLEQGRLTIGHARALLALDTPDAQVAVGGRVLTRGLSVRDTERLVNRIKPGGAKGGRRGEKKNGANRSQAGSSARDPGAGTAAGARLEAARERLENAMATRVAIRMESPATSANEDGGGAGRIEIEFYSLEDFNRLFEQLTRPA